MAGDRLRVLSTQEMACLRGRAKHKPVKAIAQELGISPHTVNSYLTEIVTKLGVSGRTEAVQLLLEQEASGAPRNSIPRDTRVSDEPEPPSSPPASDWDEHAAALAPPIAGREGMYNDLGIWQRLARITAVMLGLPIAILLLVAVYAFAAEQIAPLFIRWRHIFHGLL